MRRTNNSRVPLTRPVYLPGYLPWEIELGQHDPLSDIFVLGLVLGLIRWLT